MANHVVLMDLWWNPCVEEQAIDRAHRIGQSRTVHVTRLTVKGSVEERILELQERKRQVRAVGARLPCLGSWCGDRSMRWGMERCVSPPTVKGWIVSCDRLWRSGERCLKAPRGPPGASAFHPDPD